MVNDKQKRDFYRIAYYLYFLKKENGEIISDNYIKTKTGIYWPNNEELMHYLVTNNDIRLLDLDYCLLDYKTLNLIDNIYNQYGGYSLTCLKKLVSDDINNLNKFKNLSVEQQLDILMENIN